MLVEHWGHWCENAYTLPPVHKVHQREGVFDETRDENCLFEPKNAGCSGMFCCGDADVLGGGRSESGGSCRHGAAVAHLLRAEGLQGGFFVF